ncbi:hypothetical protein [Sedimenticola selenatireducens]|uniref:Uncharacterized protein n=2 Tax=Sedimenticola TaxID=349742 RepID=A0A558CXA5_9GAMM|nr:hypothetical protein [Sedimenticola selenatireducens]TVO69712.1 hypothetical protein FHP88_17800 [Sedimenticola selenatireducens]TVT53382.1 MAG: hypothetical protein FHK82_12060 [Sedimenticola thiotaurini]TVT62220.1 MAG: hypothetical protein FHK78_15250 [Sedimenticola selenatireducens]
MKVYPPLYLMGRKINCWRCDAKTSVVGILAPAVDYPEEFKDPEYPDDEEEPLIFVSIDHIPATILSFIQALVPGYKLQDSRTAGHEYYGNSCRACGALIGDHYIHSEPGGAFFPTNAEEAQRIYLTEIPLLEADEISAELSIGRGGLILDNAQRVVRKLE